MTSADQQTKRRRGRPATGRNPAVAAVLGTKTIGKIDRIAYYHFESRSDAIRRLLKRAIEEAERNGELLSWRVLRP